VSDDNANLVRPRGPLNRRTVLAAGGAATASAAVLAVAGCATYSSSSPSPGPANPNTAGASAPAQDTGDTDEAPGAQAPAAGGTVLGAASEVPVGGGKIFEDQAVVVTQPTAGTFRAFSAICTHQGCTVDSVAGGTINCPCHGSKFNVTDGSVAKGPAKKPLAAKQVSDEGGQLRVT
jgi:Rieske Fe-S protein